MDLSDHIASVTLSLSYADVATTAFGDTAVTRVGGLGDHSVSLEFHEDFAAGEVNATIAPLAGDTTTVSIKPVAGTTTTTNPLWSMTVLVNDWPLLDGAVGDLATASITWPVSGEVTTSTS
ncbi:MAG TPA: radical SAM protein [Acidimicrobiia bacterium]